MFMTKLRVCLVAHLFDSCINTSAVWWAKASNYKSFMWAGFRHPVIDRHDTSDKRFYQ